jgi:indolepyruvate ferredoxin oxidoreductase
LNRAIEINAVSVPFNQNSFRLGRIMAVAPDYLRGAVAKAPNLQSFQPLQTLDEVISHRSGLLTAYQDAAWAGRYRQLVDIVRLAEARVSPGSDQLSLAVAKNLAKLMSYKDEYEVARLHSLVSVKRELQATFEGPVKVRYNLAPPLISRRHPQTGHLIKREFGSWMGVAFQILARFKFLRGSALDIFGYTAERRMERDLIERYMRLVTEIAEGLDARRFPDALALVSIPEQIRGYGHVKEASVHKAQAQWDRLLDRFRNPTSARPLARPAANVA